jgi:GT2 family glycosyltransferase
MLEQIGLLDEGFFAYFEDVELALRAKLAGWETWYVTESQVVHLGGSSSGMKAKSIARRPAFWYQGRRRYFLKSYGKIYTTLADAAYLTGLALWRLRRWVLRKPDQDPEHVLLDSIRHSVFWAGWRLKTVERPSKTTAASPGIMANPSVVSA